MHSLWTGTTLALTCALLCVAHAHAQVWPEQLQPQLPFASLRHRPPVDHNADYARFDDEQVFRLDVSSLEQLKQLEAAVETHNLDLWSHLRIGSVDVRVPVQKLDLFQSATASIPSTVMIPDLQQLVSEQTSPSLLHARQGEWNFTDNSFWLKYHDFATLNNFTETMVQQFPDLVKRVSIGHTYEGREVFGMSIHGFKAKKDKKKKKPEKSRKGRSWFADEDNEDEDQLDDEEMQDDNEGLQLGGETEFDKEVNAWWSWLFGHSRKSSKKPSKPKKNPKAIIIHAGQHAREWIGPAVVSYIAKELILGYRHNKKITRLVDQFEFVIVPVLNADGYVFTWEHNRMWRKNRQPTSIPFCPGIDPNRNWGYMWNTGGSSSNPCNEGYHGPEAFAALEAKMMSDYILQRKNVVAYIDLHSYAQLWMSPFGGDCSKIPKDDEDIMEGSMGAAKALHDVHGKKYSVGSVCSLIYQSSGGSIDWTYAEANVKYSYSIELRDTGRHGFLLPEDEILPSSEETMAGIMYLANFIRKREKQWGYLV
ncbi:extracellular matrix protein 14 [Entomortierella parvispora]|uniref:Carboxypeptidase M14A n=1 Tax=Entomortierella parvispora TaxID=205924 RepID=A0A9P3HJW9_9FUNG|nr:extracellular matrix protein 14 [Entomortierella parvispora]